MRALSLIYARATGSVDTMPFGVSAVVSPITRPPDGPLVGFAADADLELSTFPLDTLLLIAPYGERILVPLVIEGVEDVVASEELLLCGVWL